MLVVALQRVGLLAGFFSTQSGKIRLNMGNSVGEVIYLTPRTCMVNFFAKKIVLKRLGKTNLQCTSNFVGEEYFARYLQAKIIRMFPKVGNLSSHPVIAAMGKLEIRVNEVKWNSPLEHGNRT